jgi:hypothetical protein
MNIDVEVLTEHQIRTYYETLRVAVPVLNGRYSGKMMHLPLSGNKDSSRLYKIQEFKIIPIGRGGVKITDADDLDDILSRANVVDLAIVVRYKDHEGREGFVDANSFLASNNIVEL